MNLSDPLGLWQVAIGGGATIGGMITFGYNSVQINFGGFIGAAEGIFGSLDLSDSGCEKVGLSTGGRAAGQLGVAAFGGKRLIGLSGDSGNAYMSNRWVIGARHCRYRDPSRSRRDTSGPCGWSPGWRA